MGVSPTSNHARVRPSGPKTSVHLRARDKKTWRLESVSDLPQSVHEQAQSSRPYAPVSLMFFHLCSQQSQGRQCSPARRRAALVDRSLFLTVRSRVL